MKGIVAEIKGKYAVVLTQEGLFQRVKATSDMEVGKEIDLSSPAVKPKPARAIAKVASLAAAGLLILGTGIAAYSYTVPYSYVYVDINPSIELTANIYDRIIRADALNPDGEELLSEYDLRNERVDTAVLRILNAAVKQGYLNNTSDVQDSNDDLIQDVQAEQKERGETGAEAGTETKGDKPGATIDEPAVGGSKVSDITNPVLITVSSKNKKKSDTLKKEITRAASEKLDKDMVESRMLVAQASVEQRDEARKYGVSPGKLVLIEDAMKGKPASELDKLKETAIRDLLKMAADKMKEDVKKTEKREAKTEKHNGKDKNNKDDRSDRNDVKKAGETKAIVDKSAYWGVGLQKNKKGARDPEERNEREALITQGNKKAQKNQENQKVQKDQKSQKDQKNQENWDDRKAQKVQKSQINRKDQEYQEDNKFRKDQKSRENQKAQEDRKAKKDQNNQNNWNRQENRQEQKAQKEQKNQRIQKEKDDREDQKVQKNQNSQKNQKNQKNQHKDIDKDLKREREQLKNELIRQISDKIV